MVISKLRKNNGASVSPCIRAKVCYALGITDVKPINSKSCSKEYWEDIVDIVGRFNNNSRIEIANAKNSFIELI